MGLEGIGEGISFLMRGFVILLVLVVLFVAYTIYSFFKQPKIESTTRLEPTIKLVTDGNSVDTIYVYKKTK